MLYVVGEKVSEREGYDTEANEQCLLLTQIFDFWRNILSMYFSWG